jgi:geranylgeranyl diphosphate synthase type I
MTLSVPHSGEVPPAAWTPPMAAREPDDAICATLAKEAEQWGALRPELVELFEDLALVIRSGGKRIRPRLCFLAATGLGASEDDPVLRGTMAALELLHLFAVITDDVMDDSALRRGMQTLHVKHDQDHRTRHLRGEARRYGESRAILVADLAFVYADAAVRCAPIDVRELFDQLRIELVMGQQLDITHSADGQVTPERAREIASLKSGRYTIRRPIELGVRIAGISDPDINAGAVEFGEPLGVAFQLKDDLHGVFGISRETGKPTDSDIRQGKPTLLYALARQRAAGRDAAILRQYGSDALADADIDAIRDVIVRTGARALVEDEIAALSARSTAALATIPFTDDVHRDLQELIDHVRLSDA